MLEYASRYLDTYPSLKESEVSFVSETFDPPDVLPNWQQCPLQRNRTVMKIVFSTGISLSRGAITVYEFWRCKTAEGVPADGFEEADMAFGCGFD